MLMYTDQVLTLSTWVRKNQVMAVPLGEEWNRAGSVVEFRAPWSDLDTQDFPSSDNKP